MGVEFLEHIGGNPLYCCHFCKTVLTNRSELMSTGFRGASGRAYLFHKAVNVKFGDSHGREMITGYHMIRDVSCKKCDKVVGWYYEYAKNEDQRYKEGKIILERAMISEKAGIVEIEASE